MYDNMHTHMHDNMPCCPQARALAIYELGLLPSSLHAFLNFKQRWGELFPRL